MIGCPGSDMAVIGTEPSMLQKDKISPSCPYCHHYDWLKCSGRSTKSDGEILHKLASRGNSVTLIALNGRPSWKSGLCCFVRDKHWQQWSSCKSCKKENDVVNYWFDCVIFCRQTGFWGAWLTFICCTLAFAVLTVWGYGSTDDKLSFIVPLSSISAAQELFRTRQICFTIYIYDAHLGHFWCSWRRQFCFQLCTCSFSEMFWMRRAHVCFHKLKHCNCRWVRRALKLKELCIAQTECGGESFIISRLYNFAMATVWH